jgi:hypothetical protein
LTFSQAAFAWRDERRQLLHLLAERTDRRLHPLPWALPIPVRVHGRYSRAEIEAAHCCAEAWRLRDPDRRRPLDPPRRRPLARTQPDRPAVRDATWPSARPRVRWESQSTTTAASPTGQRTIHHEARGSRVLLFVREHRREGGRAGGVTEPFRCLGFARYVSHEGERPMAIRWRLERSIPAGWMQGMGLAV